MFFENFPKIRYDLLNNNKLIEVIDIFRHVDVNDVLADDLLSYRYYEIQEGDRPDQVSQALYGTPDYYWTFFIVNDFLKDGLPAWPISSYEINRQAELDFDKYGVLIAQPTITDTWNLTLSGSIPEPHISNSFADIDWSYKQLRVKRNGAYAKVERFDNKMLQLVLFDFDDTPNCNNPSTSARTTFFAGDPDTHTVSLAFADGKGDNSPLGTMTVTKSLWIENQIKRTTKAFVDYSPGFLLNEQGTIPYSNSPFWQERKFDLLKSDAPKANSPRGNILTAASFLFENPTGGAQITITPTKKYSVMTEAPAYYYNSVDSPENKIDAYTALTTGKSDIFLSYGQDLIDTNENNLLIKVIRPELIDQFVDEYKRLIEL